MESAAPDFVEVHLFDRHLVDLGLGLGQSAEDRDGVAPRSAPASVGLLDHLHDVREVPVRVLLLHVNVVLGGADAASASPFRRRPTAPASSEAMASDDGGLVRAGIRQRADQHVAADAREGVQIAG